MYIWSQLFVELQGLSEVDISIDRFCESLLISACGSVGLRLCGIALHLRLSILGGRERMSLFAALFGYTSGDLPKREGLVT